MKPSSFLHNLCLWLCGPGPRISEWKSIRGTERGDVTLKFGWWRELDPVAQPTFEVLNLESGNPLESSGRTRLHSLSPRS